MEGKEVLLVGLMISFEMDELERIFYLKVSSFSVNSPGLNDIGETCSLCINIYLINP